MYTIRDIHFMTLNLLTLTCLIDFLKNANVLYIEKQIKQVDFNI